MPKEAFQPHVPDSAAEPEQHQRPESGTDMAHKRTTALEQSNRVADRRQLQYLYVRKLIADGMARAWDELVAARDQDGPRGEIELSQESTALFDPPLPEKRLTP